MAPKGKRSKAEEAADFLSTLDDFEVPASTPPQADSAPPSAVPAAVSTSTADARASIDSKRSIKSAIVPEASVPPPPSGSSSPAPGGTTEQDDEAAKALAFLEEQIKTKRAPLSVPGPGSLRTSSPLSGKLTATARKEEVQPPPNEPSTTAAAAAGGGGGWGSWWSTATTAVQAAQKIADEGYKKVVAEGVGGLEGVKVGGVDLGSLKKGAEERLKGIQGIQIQGLDLDKLRQDLLSNTQSALTTLINTVAPPISEHETLELWLSHPMIGYAGVEGVVYRAWTRILEQTESGELVVVWSAPESAEGLEERGMYPVEGWEAGWELAKKEVGAVKGREEKNPMGRGKENPNVPVTTVPIFLHLQPVLAPLPFAQPSLILSTDPSTSSASETKSPNHLHFIITLHDPTHSIQFVTTTQPSPSDWLDVEYERSDWVEERLVEVIRTGVEIVAQDYVATRMGLKSKGETPPAPSAAETSTETTGQAVAPLEEKKE